MERYCGKLVSRVTSRLHPYATLAIYMKHAAQLTQIKALYQWVWDHLSPERKSGTLTATEHVYPECESYQFSLNISLIYF